MSKEKTVSDYLHETSKEYMQRIAGKQETFTTKFMNDPAGCGDIFKARFDRQKLKDMATRAVSLPEKMVSIPRTWHKAPTTITFGECLQPLSDHDIIEWSSKGGKIRGKIKKFKEERMSEEKVLSIYKVYFFYGGKDEEVYRERTLIANSVGDAKVKSEYYELIKSDWDAQYLTFWAEAVTTVKREE